MTYAALLLTGNCCNSSPNSLNTTIAIDTNLIITSFVLAALGLFGVIGLPPVACYALIGVGSAFFLLDIGIIPFFNVIHACCGKN